MASHVKTFLLGLALGLSLTIFYVIKTAIDNTWTKTQYCQFHGAERMNVGNNKQNNTSAQEFLPDNDQNDVAIELNRRVRVLVWVMTSPKTLNTRAQAIKETWAKRCNVILYFSSKSDPNFPAVGLEVPEGRRHLTAKTMAAFRYIYENHFYDADWFMKVDDDTYVIVENLLHFLSSKDTNSPVYYGHLFKIKVKQGYYSGGSGYVIGKEALRRFGEQGINSSLCRKDGADEDVHFGTCMENLGVKTSRTVDEKDRSLFHPFPPNIHLLGEFPKWFYSYTAGTPQKGFGVSRYAISFHYVKPKDMRTMDFYFYHIRPYGIIQND